MTSSQVLELDLSEVQFEEVSDEKASIIQGGGTGDKNGNGMNGNGFPDLEVLFPNVTDAFGTFLNGLLEVESIDDFNILQEELTEDLQDALLP